MGSPEQKIRLSDEYWRRQRFKLMYILFISFGLPAIVIGFFALYTVIYEPERLSRNRQSLPQKPVDPLESPAYFVRLDALQKLANEPADRSRREIVARVVPLLNDSNFQIQDAAIDVLGKWGSPEDATALVALAHGSFSHFVRPKICEALGNIGGEESCDALVDILGMGDEERENATTALARCAPIAETVLLRRAASADVNLKRAICTALARFGTAQSIPFLRTATVDLDTGLVSAAQQAMDRIEQ